MYAFHSRMRAAVRARKEQEAAAQAIDEARAEVGGVAGDSGDDTAPPNGFDDILNEVCEETGIVTMSQMRRPQYMQVHIAHRIMTLKLMLCSAHRSWRVPRWLHPR